ncbi:hypothetical protein BWI96_06225 [Siphonobacter sp. SORGH_AS_0500]|uniref:phage integrase SAM-like domain-containing protein n=1 Tax=Siphonobacter sp. SORGH_AS_0500 TaxID=1864824 RepID=UPI000CAF6487|nr:phage integrase SAM-like domain-containing protein [Siphonobacter sp. SORGH_AS_0500]PKK37462.1 hypothetical protein BWI96_06225 [Siphonobacter sp. SORGH_AS_0500]
MRKQGKYNRVNTDIPYINDFLNNADISFQEITVPLLERYRTYVKSKRKVSDCTIVNHLIIIRILHNKAIAAGLVDYKHYPFGKEKINMKFSESSGLRSTK